MASIDPSLLEILICPETHKPLALAGPELVGRLNAAREAGGLLNRGGQPADEPIEEGLIPEGGSVVYPIIDGIPVLLIDKAIPLDQPALKA